MKSFKADTQSATANVPANVLLCLVVNTRHIHNLPAHTWCLLGSRRRVKGAGRVCFTATMCRLPRLPYLHHIRNYMFS